MDDPRMVDYLALCQAVGHIIIEWSLIEQQLDHWASIAFKQCNGKKLRKDQDIPRMFDRKKEFLKECFKTIPMLSPFKDEGLGLLKKIGDIAQKRHDVVHGALVDLAPNNRIFQFRLLIAKKDYQQERIVDFNPEKFPKLETKLADLVTKSIALTGKLADAFLK